MEAGRQNFTLINLLPKDSDNALAVAPSLYHIMSNIMFYSCST
jgi:hypothetical protein